MKWLYIAFIHHLNLWWSLPSLEWLISTKYCISAGWRSFFQLLQENDTHCEGLRRAISLESLQEWDTHTPNRSPRAGCDGPWSRLWSRAPSRYSLSLSPGICYDLGLYSIVRVSQAAVRWYLHDRNSGLVTSEALISHISALMPMEMLSEGAELYSLQ